jgi:diguanylate cyclase (GGDEF)-like protein
MASDKVSGLKTRLIGRLRREIAGLRDEVGRLSVDAVTGLAGRGVFDHALEREFSWRQRTGKDMAVVMIDLDNFKGINDEYGHPIGDLMLRRVADVIRESTRGSDVLCRYGGDEFVLIMPGATPLGVRKVTETMRADTMALKLESTPAVTISMGWTITTSEDKSAADVLKRADDALLYAKRTGRNRIHGG